MNDLDDMLLGDAFMGANFSDQPRSPQRGAASAAAGVNYPPPPPKQHTRSCAAPSSVRSRHCGG